MKTQVLQLINLKWSTSRNLKVLVTQSSNNSKFAKFVSNMITYRSLPIHMYLITLRKHNDVIYINLSSYRYIRRDREIGIVCFRINSFVKSSSPIRMATLLLIESTIAGMSDFIRHIYVCVVLLVWGSSALETFAEKFRQYRAYTALEVSPCVS